MCVLLSKPKSIRISIICMPMHAVSKKSKATTSAPLSWIFAAFPLHRDKGHGVHPLHSVVCGVSQAQKPIQVTCPFGSLDPLMDRAHLAVFPVPAGLLQGTAELHTDAQRSGLDETRYGQSFCSNAFKGDAAAMLAAAQRQAYMSCLHAHVSLVGQSKYVAGIAGLQVCQLPVYSSRCKAACN